MNENKNEEKKVSENKGKEIITNNPIPTKSVKNNGDMKKKLMRMMLIVVGILVLFLIIILIMSFFKSGNKTYEEIEEELKNAAIEYYEVQSGLLPQEEGETITVKASTLADAELMKPLSELREGESCSGRVEVTKVGDNIVYTPYLDCGDNYTTKELYKAVLEQGIVTSGNGLYDMNGELVYRGENPNNYVKFADRLWRIVKFENDSAMLILDDKYARSVWDDRFNTERNRNDGINDYSAPAIGAFSYVPEITISGSEIYAYRGTTGNASYADYIGQGGKSSGYQGGQIQGTIKNTTVHKYLYQMRDYISTPEGVVEFDENGIGTEQSQ